MVSATLAQSLNAIEHRFPNLWAVRILHVGLQIMAKTKDFNENIKITLIILLNELRALADPQKEWEPMLQRV